MESSKKYWLYGGALLLALVSCSLIIGGGPSVWAPAPLLIVISAYLTMFLFPLVTPLLYMLVLKFVFSSKNLPENILYLVLGFGVLNIVYIQGSWDYGVKYQGLEHTKIVAIENLVGFGLALAFAVTAFKKKSRPLALLANLILFILLSWCAFPYLGELL